jgi:secernin
MCDTFVALPPATADGSVIFGKNSDREPNEAQVLEYHPAEQHPAAARIQCTYISIPQVRETRAVLLCRPFWMWGAEMGANDRGVTIGNEAVFTKMPYSKTDGLTGMDLLRLALERSVTADDALETIVGLLSDHGQGGICGYRDKSMRYHNSFIIADPAGAWVLETAGPMWAAVKVTDIYSISNGLTIGENFDRSHPDLVETARSKGWVKKNADFHFATAYSDWLFTTFSACRRRCTRSSNLMRDCGNAIGVADALTILQDHHDDDYQPDRHFLTNRLCVHAGNGLTRNSGTTGSLAAHLTSGAQTFWATGTSAPCISIFKPVRFTENVLPDLGPTPGETYNQTSCWWRHEMLHRLVLEDYRDRSGQFTAERDRLQSELLKHVADSSGQDISGITRDAFREAAAVTDGWISLVKDRPVSRKARWGFRRYWHKQNKSAGIQIR